MTTTIILSTVFLALAVVSVISLASTVFANEQSQGTQNGTIPPEIEEYLNQKISNLIENRDILVDENMSNESHLDMSADEIDLYNRMAKNANERFVLIKEDSTVAAQIEHGDVDDYQVAYLEKIQNKISELENQAKAYVEEHKSMVAPIDPEFKAKLRAAQKIIAESDLKVGVGVNSKTGTVRIDAVLERQHEEAELRKQIEHMIDVPYTLNFVETGDTSCNNQDSDCNPLIGGIQIQARLNATHAADCTLSIPAVRNILFGTESGFISAGHCFTNNPTYDDVFQPTLTDPKVGEVTRWQNSGTCDCAFVKKQAATH